MNTLTRIRVIEIIKNTLPSTLSTCWWVVSRTVIISFIIVLLEYVGLLPIISTAVEPVFKYFGLPGEAALAFVTGYFANVYSAIAIATTLELDTRAITILSAMILCSHNMIIETAVQKKTGTSALMIVLIRTFSAIFLGLLLNLIMPESNTVITNLQQDIVNPSFSEMLINWLMPTGRLVLKISIIIIALNIVQRFLSELGVIKYLSKFLKPLLAIFGLPARCSFLWIIANIIGLAYGAAAMIDEVEQGKLKKRDIDLTNIHISISHSNLEDIIILASIGGIWWILLLSRWVFSIILVWGYRLIIPDNQN